MQCSLTTSILIFCEFLYYTILKSRKLVIDAWKFHVGYKYYPSRKTHLKQIAFSLLEGHII
jgi:hypothetical protein